ncbi:ExeM/NucH family extracellular endonuclease [Isoptericola sp. b441]|uniref:ExeM/NucH family extracellular endonuclease n=1 Tax=Actinotalea lenta TaxID=3064654 RepID=A0ABT9D9M8_9CELL|nr:MULTISPECIES: ExeM/NucH family extracellular endonuclease [unclassified Isoptericola]MDO8105883.1 ExeM/NucH family extracellular endonuclease [Isoptericola sp. b441]MDO8122599.1 ExeM/NucH family extracellular endonuclease [Isoptericola sp. b490]
MKTHVQGRPGRLFAAAAGALALTAAVVVPAQGAESTTTIAQVQGTGDTSPMLDQTVVVDGVVTADHRTGGYRGLYVQTAGSGGASDATPGASDGVFVYLGGRTTDAAIGDAVQVTGVVTEYYGLTEINASRTGGSVAVTGPGVLPQPVSLPDSVLGSDREQYEGMLVDPTDDYLVASLHEVDRYGTVWLSAGLAPLVTSTEATRPGPDAVAIAADNAARRLLLDDAKSQQVTAQTQPYLTADHVVRVGDQLDSGDLTYVLSYGYDEWRLQPLTPIDASTPASQKASFSTLDPRPEAPTQVGGDLQLATFNVFNYFTTFRADDDLARGADDQAQFDIQKAKIVAAISALGADVVALQEIENAIHFGSATPDAAIADLVDGLNAAAGAGTWAYVPTPAALYGDGAPATDVIMNAIIYRPAAVVPVGDATTDVDETVWDIAREPIAQRFSPVDGSGDFWVIANHFKSKGGDGPEPADGQGLFNAERVAQATAVRDLAQRLVSDSGVASLAVMGDLNSYAHEDPVQVFLDAGYTDVVPTLAAGQYTYTYDGERGSLDHVLVDPALAVRLTGAGVWDINASEWPARGYYGAYPDASTVYRASDHDPILVGITAFCTIEYRAWDAHRTFGAFLRVHASGPLGSGSVLTWTAGEGTQYLTGFGVRLRQRGDQVTVTGTERTTVTPDGAAFGVLGLAGPGGPAAPSSFALDGHACTLTD